MASSARQTPRSRRSSRLVQRLSRLARRAGERLRPGPRLRRIALATLGTLLAGAATFELAVLAGEFPRADLARPTGSVRLLDVHGRLLREVLNTRGARARWVPLSRISPLVMIATVAAEDARFFHHKGIDARGVLRASLQNISAGRVVSGASTITMQVARLIHPHARRRSFGGKLREALEARRLERAFSKATILEQYLNRAPYGPALIGVEAASLRYFGRSARELSLGQAALLATLPKAPSALDPLRHPERARARRHYVLSRMRTLGLIDDAALAQASLEPLTVALRRGAELRALHFTDWVLARLRRRGARRGRRDRGGVHKTTLDLALQRDVAGIVGEHLAGLAVGGATNAAVVVLDNARCSVRALVGSAGYFKGKDGAVNGALALRQPGSTLKPFTYALAFERGDSPASVVADVETRYTDRRGRVFSPRNYSGDFSGPVLLGDALGRSLNVPAIRVAQRVGVVALLSKLRRLGFRLEGPAGPGLASLKRAARHYGLGLTLGNGEVTLVELAQAYATLARGGIGCRARILEDAPPASGDDEVIDPKVAFLVRQMLSEDHLRLEAFGPANALMLGFPVAVKTGTSSNFRDNWAIGFTTRHTVAVWIGDFSGRSLEHLSGATGAGPLFHRIFEHIVAKSGKRPEVPRPPKGIAEVTVCTLSGKLPTAHCPRRRTLYTRLAHVPKKLCTWHRVIAIDKRNALRAGPGCETRHVSRRVFTVLPAEYARWQALQGQAVAPARYSPHCPRKSPSARGVLTIVQPKPGQVYILEPGYDPRTQSVELRARANRPVSAVEWRLDGKRLARARWPYAATWRLAKGRHVLEARAPGQQADRVQFEVR